MAATIELERVRAHPDMYAATIPEDLSVCETLVIALAELEDCEITEIDPLYDSIPIEEIDSLADAFTRPGHLCFDTHGYSIEIVNWETLTLTELVTPDNALENFTDSG